MLISDLHGEPNTLAISFITTVKLILKKLTDCSAKRSLYNISENFIMNCSLKRGKRTLSNLDPSSLTKCIALFLAQIMAEPKITNRFAHKAAQQFTYQFLHGRGTFGT